MLDLMSSLFDRKGKNVVFNKETSTETMYLHVNKDCVAYKDRLVGWQ